MKSVSSMMHYITGIARNQMTFTSLEQNSTKDNPVRFIDAFVENVDLGALGFELQTLKKEGRPGYSTRMFLKIYLYG
jgi:transposase